VLPTLSEVENEVKDHLPSGAADGLNEFESTARARLDIAAVPLRGRTSSADERSGAVAMDEEQKRRSRVPLLARNSSLGVMRSNVDLSPRAWGAQERGAAEDLAVIKRATGPSSSGHASLR